MIGQIGVHGDDLAVHGTEERADRLDRLDLAELIAGGHRRADFRQFHVHQVGELFECERRNAHRGHFAAILLGDVRPFVCFGKQEVLGFHVPFLR